MNMEAIFNIINIINLQPQKHSACIVDEGLIKCSVSLETVCAILNFYHLCHYTC